ncbi:unnamed protein product, partial [Discosporangium mesarthrocarpum]
EFNVEAVSSLPAESLLQDLVEWKAAGEGGRKRRFFFCSYPFLINTEKKKAMLEAEAMMEQRRAADQSGVQYMDGGLLLLNPYLVLMVDRQHL